MLNRRWGQVISEIEPKDSTLPISISSSDNEHSYDLARFPPQSVREVESVRPSSVESDIIRFRNLKKATPVVDPYHGSFSCPLTNR